MSSVAFDRNQTLLHLSAAEPVTSCADCLTGLYARGAIGGGKSSGSATARRKTRSHRHGKSTDREDVDR